jgi:hypothetical protein
LVQYVCDQDFRLRHWKGARSLQLSLTYHDDNYLFYFFWFPTNTAARKIESACARLLLR